ncbi:hypothetical protein NDN08_001636 [Rhodosorus marinus]|uniref:Uncharacterized protein n=1 Tax=Rhodosorus marinus TaxID=101924 RepID=A0AAV8UX62_9RHOD|nr:hypothetical protein NDN08_001636 [Rhodosorus marinus]
MYVEENWARSEFSPGFPLRRGPATTILPPANHLPHARHELPMMSPVMSSYPCVSCPRQVVRESPQNGYYHVPFQQVQQARHRGNGGPEQSPVMQRVQPLPTTMGSKGSPVLSLCSSGHSDFSAPNLVRPVNPGLNLLCQAVEEAHSNESESFAPLSPTETRVKGPWRAEEDKLLCELVKKFGPRRWTAIASFINGRTGKQSRERWLNHLNPDLSKRQWTLEEDQIIMEAHHEIGNKWSEIAKRLKGRTDNSVKNRFNTTIRRQISEYSTFVRQKGIKRKDDDPEANSKNRQDTIAPPTKRPMKEEKTTVGLPQKC